MEQQENAKNLLARKMGMINLLCERLAQCHKACVSRCLRRGKCLMVVSGNCESRSKNANSQLGGRRSNAGASSREARSPK